MNITNDIKTQRFYLLFALYIASEADYDYTMNLESLGKSRGISGPHFKKVYKYFLEENFIEKKDGGGEYQIGITHNGIKAIEEVFLDQYRHTYYFPSFRDMMR
ncbi:MAG: hypothetical protein AAGI07_18990 [Bacteroidota bacterium]